MLLALLQFFSAQFLYLALHLESGSFPRPLTPKEEAAAFEALRAGDSAAREKIIQHNLRLVAHIAKKYYALPSDQDDLISIGTIGLIKAVNTFDSIENATLSPRPFWRTWLEKRAGFSGFRRGGASLDKLRPVSSF